MVATVIIDKHAWHKPLYRQAQNMALQSLPIDRSTLADRVDTAAAELTQDSPNKIGGMLRVQAISLSSPKARPRNTTYHLALSDGPLARERDRAQLHSVWEEIIARLSDRLVVCPTS